MIGSDSGKVDDRGMQIEFGDLARARLVANDLLNLVRHTSDTNQFRANFGGVASDVRSFHFGERCSKISGFYQSGLSPLRNGLVEHQVADIPQEAIDEEPLAFLDAAGFGNLSGQQGAKDAPSPEGWEVHEVCCHPRERLSDGGGGD